MGQVQADTSNYLNHRDHPRVDAENGILLDDGSGTDLLIHDMPSLLEYAASTSSRLMGSRQRVENSGLSFTNPLVANQRLEAC